MKILKIKKNEVILRALIGYIIDFGGFCLIFPRRGNHKNPQYILSTERFCGHPLCDVRPYPVVTFVVRDTITTIVPLIVTNFYFYVPACRVVKHPVHVSVVKI